MKDEELLKFARRIVACVLNDCDPSDRKGIAEEVAVDLRTIARAAAEQEREACAMLCDVKAQSYDAIVDGMGQSRQAVTLRGAANAIRSRAAAGGGPNG